MAFCTRDEVKTHLFKSTSGSVNDAIIDQLIPQVDQVITHLTGVKTGTSPGDLDISNEIVDGDCNLVIRARHKPINSLTTIERRDANNNWETWTDETPDEFEDEKIYLKTHTVTGPGHRRIRLTYNAGYETANVPKDLNLAAILLVCGLYNHRNNVGFKSQTALGLQLQMDDKDHAYIRKTLTKYKMVYAL